MMTSLDFLKQTGTVIVTDSGDFETIDVYKPQDATTNPSLLLAAAEKDQYRRLVDAALDYARQKGGSLDQQASAAMDRLLIEFGKEILKVVPGRVSTEVDARLSYDSEASKSKARELIKLYESVGIKRDRVLIKIASTWEGIQAARDLEQEGIHCNLTLMFSMPQAVACAEAGVTLISPFVGRILDWFKKTRPGETFDGPNDPGVQFVSEVFTYFKTQGIKTIIMGASFRSTDEIMELAGLDFLTISPSLLQILMESTEPVAKKLDADAVCELAKKISPIPRRSYINDEALFRKELASDQQAIENLENGIKKFAEDGLQLMAQLKEQLSST